MTQLYICIHNFSCAFPLWFIGAALVAQKVKNPPAMQETQVRSLAQEDALEKGMTIQFIVLAWRIPWTEDSGLLEFIGSPNRVRQDSKQRTI